MKTLNTLPPLGYLARASNSSSADNHQQQSQHKALQSSAVQPAGEIHRNKDLSHAVAPFWYKREGN